MSVAPLLPSALPAVALAAACTARAWRRTAWYSPATLWSGFCLAGLVSLWAVIAAQVHLPALALSPMPTLHLDEQFPAAALFFSVQALIGPLAVAGWRPPPGAAGRAQTRAGAATLALALARVRRHPASLAYAVFAFALAAAHLALIDKQSFYLNTEYLSLADPDRNGLGEGFGAFVNNALRPLCLPAFLLLAIRPETGARRGPDLRAVLLLAVCAYVFAFSLAVYSRYLMVYVFVFFLGRIFTRRRGGLGAALSFAVQVALILACFVVALSGRSFQTQGLGSVLAVLEQLDPGHAGWLATKLAVTSFDGAMSFANGLRMAPRYEAEYQILSFSPFPSFIDGFAAIEREMAARINIYVPMSAFSEVAHFHPLAAPAFFVICALGVRQLTLGFFRDHDALTAALFPVFLVCLLKIQTYSLRSSLRIFVAIALISWLSCRMRRWRERRDSAREAEAALGRARAEGLQLGA